jgi:hypothetical protein
MKWFRIVTDTGEVVRISVMLRGLPLFASALLANVPVERIEVPARELLKETAEGNPPSVWQ